MKKSAAAFVALVAIVLIGLPPLFGGMAEDSLTRQLEEAPIPPYLEIRMEDYERGWFTSAATIDVRLAESFVASEGGTEDGGGADAGTDSGTGAATGDARVRIEADISHGPLGFRGGPFVGLARGVMSLESTSDELEELRERLGVPYLVEGRYRLGFGGASHLSLEVPAIDFQDGAVLVETSGTTFRGTYHPRSRRISGDAAMESFELSDGETNTLIESMRFDMDGTLRSPMLMLGTFSFETDRISIASPLGSIQRTAIVGLEMTGETELADDGATFSSVVEYGVDSVQVNDQTLREARLRMAARSIDVEVMDAYGEVYQQLMTSQGLDAEEAMAEEMAEDMMEMAYDLFAADPVLEVESLSFDYEGETFEASGRIAVDGAALPDRSAFQMEDPDLWLGIFTASAELEASKALVLDWAVTSQEASLRMQVAEAGIQVFETQIEQAAREQGQELIAAYLAEGLLVENSDSYETRIGFENGALSLNGQPMEMPAQ